MSTDWSKISQMLTSYVKKVNNWVRNVWNSSISRQFRSVILAQACVNCRQSCEGHICGACRTQLDQVRIDPGRQCHRCGIPLPGSAVCDECLSGRFAFDETIAVFIYKPPISQMITQYKFHAKLPLSGLFAMELLRAIRLSSAALPDVIVPVPLHVNRLISRGFNQSWEIARQIGRALNCPATAHYLHRKRDTLSQSGLARIVRMQNLRDAFYCETALTGKRVAVVDDVLTTGATLSEIARCLKAQGATSVVNWVIARTPYDINFRRTERF